MEEKGEIEMDNLANTETNGLSRLEALGHEARLYSEAAAMNLFQLGRVLTEARGQCKHGEWGPWLQKHTSMSDRSAQQIMGIYRRFGDRPEFQGIDRAKLFSMLALPEGTEDDFAADNDLNAMTSRAVREAVQQARAEAQAQIDAANEARMEAERRAAELEARPPELPDDVAETLRSQETKIEQLQTIGQDAMKESRRLQRENERLTREVQDQADLLSETQENLSAAQQALLSAQSVLARGDAERIPSDALTLDTFSAAVSGFIGATCRMPHMQTTFAAMDHDTWSEYDALLSAVEEWARGARTALNTANAEGSVV